MRRTRGLALSFIVRGKLADASCSHTRAAEALGVSRQRLDAILDEGLLQPGDLLVLEELAPGIIAAWLKGKFRVQPEHATGTMRAIMDGLATTMMHMGALTSKTTAALPDGIDNPEAREIEREIEMLHAKLGELQASVAAAVVVR